MNRFSETDKWKDAWFRKLPAPSKLLFLFIIDTCDNAGFFEMDVELCAFITKMEEKHILGAIEGLKRGLLGSDKKEGLFYVKNFLRHQRNLPLNPENNAHRQIIRLLEEKKTYFESNSSFFRGLLGPLYSIGNGTGKKKGSPRGKNNYTEDFELWWKAFDMKGSKIDAFKRWKEAKTKPELSTLIESTKKYVAHCKAVDRTQRDGAGYMSGKLWETDWEKHKPESSKPIETSW